jgi:cysteamine dioxygenase
MVLVNEAKQPVVQQPEARLAEVKVNSNLTACAVLDVLGPPYGSDSDGRHCQFYFDFPFSNISGIMVHLQKVDSKRLH